MHVSCFWMSENTLSQDFESEGSVSCHNARSGSRRRTLQQIQQAAKQKGFASTAAMIRHAVDQELSSGDGVEQRIVATLDRIQGDLSRMQRAQQTLFAFVDTLAKVLLTDLPEQSSASVARGKERYERFLKSTAATMLNGSHPLLREGAER
jgi:hypothetical protein